MNNFVYFPEMSQGRADSMFEFRLKKHTQYIPENLEKAVEAVLSGSMSQCRAAVVFGVSQPTISRHVIRRREKFTFLNKYKI